MKIAIGVATTGQIKTKTLLSIVKLVKRNPKNTYLIAWEGCNVHQNRINIVKTAIEGKCTHLLFVDSDMVFDEDALERLMAHDKDIIGVNAVTRSIPPVSTVKLHDENGNKIFEASNELFECQAVGTGFMLIKISVFNEIPKPWFFFEHNENGDMKTGSDMWFCNQAKKSGLRVWCDPTVKVGHIGDYIYV